MREAPLENEKQEKYAQRRAKGLKPASAAIAAGYAKGSSVYSGLEQDKDVLDRIEYWIETYKAESEQKRDAARAMAKVVGEHTGVGRAWVIGQLAENAQIARQDGDYKESNAALKLIGDELGMFQGGSSDPDENPGNIPASLDLDAIAQLAAHGNKGFDLETGEVQAPEPDDEAENERIAMAIANMAPNNRVKHGDRTLSDSPEADLALEEDEEDDQGEFEEEEEEEDDDDDDV